MARSPTSAMAENSASRAARSRFTVVSAATTITGVSWMVARSAAMRIGRAGGHAPETHAFRHGLRLLAEPDLDAVFEQRTHVRVPPCGNIALLGRFALWNVRAGGSERHVLSRGLRPLGQKTWGENRGGQESDVAHGALL